MKLQIKSVVSPMLPRTLKTLLSVLLMCSGLVAGPYVVAAEQPVIDQQPLTSRVALAPNIVLMLDDSGSMASDYMPDLSYLANYNDNDALIDAANNGVYYNPTVTYTPPVHADGSSYTSQTDLTEVPQDGFASSTSNRDLTQYYSRTIDYSVYNLVTHTGVSSSSCEVSNYPGSVYAYVPSNNKCAVYYGLFQYSTDSNSGSGPYTVHYVGTVADACTSLSNCVVASDTSGTAAPSGLAAGTNIANWFAYYHTRILMAKSSLTLAFASMDPTYRFGYGSIDGSGFQSSDGMAGTVAFTTHHGSRTSYSTGITKVYPFGSEKDTTSQRVDFWNWLTGRLSPNGYTPLRQALDYVGQYYQTTQPWQSTTTTVNADGTTTTTTSTDTYSCRQSYTILTTDGFWNGNDPSTAIGNADGTAGPSITDPKDGSNKSRYTPADPYQDSWGATHPTLADVAMYYWNHDLQSSLANDVPTSDADPAFWQHMTTFTVGLGFEPEDANKNVIDMSKVFSWAQSADPSQTTWSDLGVAGWPEPASDSINNIADLAHAGLNGHGGFYSAKNPQGFASAIKSALNQASSRVGTGASLAANSTKLDTDTYTYQASYFTQKWTGDLKAFTVSPTSKSIVTPAVWSAGDELASMAATCTASTATNCDISSLDIKTINPSNGSVEAFSGSNFGGLDSTLQTALGSADMVRYLRGNAAYEEKNGGPYRNRETPLGDIVDSQPVYVGRPDPNLYSGNTYLFSGATSYFTWATSLSSATPTAGVYDRWPVLYVASNDGMLHGFLATTEYDYDNQGAVTATYPAGTQLFAYMPAATILNGVTNLSATNYGDSSNPHQYFNDGELTVADAYWNKDWHTILVGTTGRGPAKAIYAIDVTDPQNPQPLWERSAGDGKTNSGYIGQMVGKPLIVQTDDGSWSVLVGNGYNSANDVAALLQFNLQTGDLAVHTVTDNTDPATSSSAPNGLAAPASLDVTSPADGIQDIAYAGDLLGHVWRFSDLSAVNGSATSVTASTTGVTKIFTTQVVTNPTSGSSEVQPITAGMLAGIDPTTKYRWVFFGTGQYLNNKDLDNKSTQSWYGIITYDPVGHTLTTGKTVTNLAQRTIVSQVDPTTTTLGQRYFTLSQDATDLNATSGSVDLTKAYGWYMNLLKPDGTGGTIAEGERMVTPNQFQGSLLIGTSRIPDSSDPCNPSGRGWIMGLNPFTGTNVSLPFMDVNGDGVVDSQDSITINGKTYPAGAVGFNSLPNNPIFVGNTMLVSFDDGSTGQIQTSGGGTAGGSRTSWRELLNQ